MHRHGYQGRKLSRERGPREALLRGLVTSLVLHENIETTDAKASEMVPRFEKLVTAAKKGTLAGRRQLSAELLTERAARKLNEELLPAFKERQGGYVTKVKLAPRRGDGAPMTRVSLILPAKPAKDEKASKDAKSEKPTKQAPKKAEAEAKKEEATV
jgi:large subunit ribosomal protein L17